MSSMSPETKALDNFRMWQESGDASLTPATEQGVSQEPGEPRVSDTDINAGKEMKIMEFKTKATVTGTVEKKMELGTGIAVLLNCNQYYSKLDGEPACKKLYVPVQFEAEIAQNFVDANPKTGDKLTVTGHMEYGPCLAKGHDAVENALYLYVDMIDMI